MDDLPTPAQQLLDSIESKLGDNSKPASIGSVAAVYKILIHLQTVIIAQAKVAVDASSGEVDKKNWEELDRTTSRMLTALGDGLKLLAREAAQDE